MKGYVLFGLLLLGFCILQAESDVSQKTISVPGFPPFKFDVRSANAVVQPSPVETELQSSPFDLDGTSTRAEVDDSTSKIGLGELIYTICFNAFHVFLNFLSGNYIAIFINVLNIAKALVLFLFGN